MSGKLRIPPLQKQEEEEEQHYLVKNKNGFLVNVPESKVDDWTKSQEQGSKIPDSLKQRAKEDLLRMLRGE